MAERWKDVVGYEGLYIVSTWGSVRTVQRVVMRSNGAPHTVRAKELKGWAMGRYGHRYVGLYNKKGVNTTTAVHRTVLEAFVGPCPDGMECRHLDGDPTNNFLTNLKWGTPQENMDDRERHGRHNKGSNCVNAVLTDKVVLEIRERLKEPNYWGLLSDIGKDYGVHAATVRDIRDNRIWQHLP